ncbi:hypothetical protein EDC55_11064 [Allofrancisella inopinata]|uniref:hypothetical protein n=1 Tax=Allofrancisella inopinata TaxID=1085647 RepID=UPI0010E3A2FE|nr:hypothetical protein [Allofrancisella inopinata]TDT71731.1 hypothetical protein EDC55_11064 [Allofrancisella inopinata]
MYDILERKLYRKTSDIVAYDFYMFQDKPVQKQPLSTRIIKGTLLELNNTDLWLVKGLKASYYYSQLCYKSGLERDRIISLLLKDKGNRYKLFDNFFLKNDKDQNFSFNYIIDFSDINIHLSSEVIEYKLLNELELREEIENLKAQALKCKHFKKQRIINENFNQKLICLDCGQDM